MLILVSYILALVGGCMCGWALRSLVFFAERDCANPEHNNEDSSV